MLPYANLIHLDRKSEHPIYLQIVNQLIRLIQRGKIPIGAKLPGSRNFAKMLLVHRNTVVKALDELEAMGWIIIKPNSGTYVVEHLPLNKPDSWKDAEEPTENSRSERFKFYTFPHISAPYSFLHPLAIDDGLPDIRLAPVDELARAYARNMRLLARGKKLTYTDARGNLKLRRKLAKMLNETRGLNVDEENIMITRGTIMAIHLSISVSVRAGDKVVVGESNYQTADTIFNHFGAELIKIPVDRNGLDTGYLAEICKKQKIRVIYVTSHHHHPTTVSLSPERRLQLLRLAEIHNFLILEDDYDYDYHYSNSPILPLASGDSNGRVLYFGSFTKVLAPAFRIGYLVAPKDVINELPKLRRLLDRQGDMVLEQSMADLIEDGTLRRHLKKSWRIYKERRDRCISLLRRNFETEIDFAIPAGGMAIWAKFDKKIHLPTLAAYLMKKGLFLSSGTVFNQIGKKENACRLGFASLKEEEMKEALHLLREGIDHFRLNSVT